jgi:hypothetical protein
VKSKLLGLLKIVAFKNRSKLNSLLKLLFNYNKKFNTKNPFMITKNIILIALLLLITNHINCQIVTKESTNINYQKGVGIETFFQGNYGIGLGGIVGNNIGNRKESNYSMGIYTDVFLLDAPIIGPRLKMTYNYVGIFGLSLNLSNYFRSGINDFRVAVDLNFTNHGIMTFFIGYGMQFSENSFNEIGQFRLGINLALVNNMD